MFSVVIPAYNCEKSIIPAIESVLLQTRLDLVEIDCEKSFSGQKGLSSHLREMHLGRKQCVKELCELGLISPTFMRLILAFNELKYILRVGICTMQRLKYEVLKGEGVKRLPNIKGYHSLNPYCESHLAFGF